MDISYDILPYSASYTQLDSLFPHWFRAYGVGKICAMLKEGWWREALRKEMEKNGGQRLFSSTRVYSTKKKECEWMKGLTLKQIMESVSKGCDPYDFLFDLFLEHEGQVDVFIEDVSEENIKALLKKPYAMVCTNSPLLDQPHPCSAAAFAKVFRKYVRELKLLSLEEAVHKLTGLCAKKFRIMGRGILREGMYADIVLFDEEGFVDTADYAEPQSFAEGVYYLMINGELVINEGAFEEKMCGRVIRHVPIHKK
jgi:N-acyl-D-aspartate/D-glutamate deacylase